MGKVSCLQREDACLTQVLSISYRHILSLLDLQSNVLLHYIT